MNALRNFIEQIGSRRALLMGGVAAAMLIGLGWMAMRPSTSDMGYLFTDLDPAAAQSITEKLRGQSVPFQLSADGTAVMAPVDRLAELRMSLASEQLGGKIGYEVLDEEEPFGISSSRAKINETRAIEGELVRSIESIDTVRKARVHVVMPERALFENEPRKASAAVTVATTGRLPKESVQAIRYLVSSAVPGLAPDAVSIVDQSGALLARAGEGGDGAGGDLEEHQASLEARLRSEIEAMLEPIVGRGKVRAEVAAKIERDQVREESQTFDPDNQVVAHQVTVESSDQNDENSGGADGVSVGTQLPDDEMNLAGGNGDSRRSARNETSEDVTYDNSRTQKVAVRGPGEVTRLTVAVMVDPGEKGLPAAQVQRMQRLVENAVVYDAARGHSVVVEAMKFSAPDAFEEDSGGLPFGITGGRVFDIVKLLVVGGIVLFAIRMLKGQNNRPPLLEGVVEQRQVAGEDEAGVTELTGHSVDQYDEEGNLLEDQTRPAGDASLNDEIALAQVDGQIKQSALRRIGGTVAASPAESASVIRQWMNT